MLIEFRTSNFLSFEDEATLSMVASADKTFEEDNVIHVSEKLRLLKSATIYGANASGKSNFLKALSFMRALILYAPEISRQGVIPDRTFRLNSKGKKEPSYFEILFLKNGMRFRYGFEVGQNRIASEWLFYTPTSRETLLFTRNEEGITIGSSFKEGRGLEERVKDNRLFLPLVADLNNDSTFAQSVVDWFWEADVMRSLELERTLGVTLHLLGHGKRFKGWLLNFLQRFDLGIVDFEIQEAGALQELPDDVPKDVRSDFSRHKRPEIIIKRNKYHDGKLVGVESFDLLKDESEGTRKLFALGGFLLSTVEGGGILVVDELEARLHPMITRAIVQIFNSEKLNKKSAQLIFSTHDTNLLSNAYFRRDQIWFVEKSTQGTSCLYSLAEYRDKPRKDASYGKDYILGRYGAVPYIENIDSLLKEAKSGADTLEKEA